jgi:four helix bundle protein
MSKPNKGYLDLVVWQKSMELAKTIYDVTKQFPKEEQYGLTQQIKRSAVSIPSNIAEGSARNSMKEFKQFLAIASGSAAELKTQLLLSESFGFLGEDQTRFVIKIVDEVARMLYGLSASLESNQQLTTNN